MVQFSLNNNQIKKTVISLTTYAVVFLLMNLSIAYYCYDAYGFQKPIDWVLTSIYLSLSLFSYYFFVVNDIRASSFKSRTTALGFLAVHLALTVIVMSFLFEAPVKLAWYLAGLLLGLSYLLGFYGISHWSKKHQSAKKQLQIELMTDELTQLCNRRALAQHAIEEQQFANKSNTHLSVLILDIDDFKVVNDCYGHSVGDEVLRQISQLLKYHINDLGEVYRWGGEEFVVLLPVTGLFEANQVANKLVRKVAEKHFNIQGLLELQTTISVGVAQWLSSESICKETLERADKALYKAKAAGKNAVVVSDFKAISINENSKGQSKFA